MFSRTLGQKHVRLLETLHRLLAFYVGKASWQQCTKGMVCAGMITLLLTLGGGH